MRIRLRTLLKLFVVLVVALIVAAVAIVLSVDPADYKGVVERQIEQAIGRRVAFEGPVELEFGLVPRLAFEDVSVANMDGGSEPEMARVGRFEVTVELVPLLRGDIRISRIALSEVDLLLERDNAGRANWQFAGGEEAAAPAGSAPAASEPQPRRALPALGQLLMDRVRVTWVGEETHRFEIASAAINPDGVSGTTGVEIAMALDEVPLTASGRVGSIAGALTGAAAWPVDLALGIGDARIGVEGTVAIPPAVGSTTLSLVGTIPSLEPFGRLSGVELPTLPAIDLSAKAEIGLNRLVLSQLMAAFGGTRVEGDLDLALAGERPRITGRLAPPTIVFADFGADGAGSASAGGPMIPPAPLPFEALGALDAAIELAVGRLDAGGLVMTDVAGHLELDAGRLTLDIDSAMVAEGGLSGSVMLDGRSDPGAMAIDLAGAGLSSAELGMAATGRADVAVEATGAGRDLRSWLADAGGSVAVDMSGVRLSGYDLGSVAGLIGGDPSLDCVLGRFRLAGGGLDVTRLVADGPQLSVVGSGRVDLLAERVDLLLSPTAKGLAAGLDVPLRVSGPISGPTVAPDPGALAGRSLETLSRGLVEGFTVQGVLGGVLGGAGTGGASGCLEVEAPPPSGETAPIEDGARDIIEGIERELPPEIQSPLRGLFGQ